MDCPREVLPTPGGPTKHRIGALAVGLSLRTPQLFEDTLFDILEVEVIFVKHLPSPRHQEALCQLARAMVGEALPRAVDLDEVGHTSTRH